MAIEFSYCLFKGRERIQNWIVCHYKGKGPQPRGPGGSRPGIPEQEGPELVKNHDDNEQQDLEVKAQEDTIRPMTEGTMVKRTRTRWNRQTTVKQGGLTHKSQGYQYQRGPGTNRRGGTGQGKIGLGGVQGPGSEASGGCGTGESEPSGQGPEGTDGPKRTTTGRQKKRRIRNKRAKTTEI